MNINDITLFEMQYKPRASVFLGIQRDRYRISLNE